MEKWPDLKVGANVIRSQIRHKSGSETSIYVILQ